MSDSRHITTTSLSPTPSNLMPFKGGNKVSNRFPREISLTATDLFSHEEWKELLAQAFCMKLPYYLLAAVEVLEDREPVFSFYDAAQFRLYSYGKESADLIDPATTRTIERVHYFMANVWDLEVCEAREGAVAETSTADTTTESAPAITRLTTPKNQSFSLLGKDESPLLDYLTLSLDLFIEGSARTIEEKNEIKTIRANSLERLAETFQTKATKEASISLAISLQNKALKWAYAAKECQNTPEREATLLMVMEKLEELKQIQQEEREKAESQERAVMEALKCLTQGEHISTPAIVEATGLSRRAVVSLINKWSAQGILSVKTEGKHKLYSLKQQFAMSVEEAISAIEASSNLERRILASEAWLEGVCYGKPRKGHPEGKIIYHVLEVLKNIAELDCSPEERKKLRLLAILHDSFKHMGSTDEPRIGSNHHGYFAKEFALSLGIESTELLKVLELHDEAYYIWTNANKTKDWATAEVAARALLDELGEAKELYVKFYECDCKTGDKSHAPFEWFNDIYQVRLNSLTTGSSSLSTQDSLGVNVVKEGTITTSYNLRKGCS